MFCRVSPNEDEFHGRWSDSKSYGQCEASGNASFHVKGVPCHNPSVQEGSAHHYSHRNLLLHNRFYWVHTQRMSITEKYHQHKHLFQQHRRTLTHHIQQKSHNLLILWQQTSMKILLSLEISTRKQSCALIGLKCTQTNVICNVKCNNLKMIPYDYNFSEHFPLSAPAVGGRLHQTRVVQHG